MSSGKYHPDKVSACEKTLSTFEWLDSVNEKG